MTKFHIVDRFNRAAYDEAMLAYYRARHKVFVEERGWTELARRDGIEIDQYDTDDTIHLLAIDGDRLVGGSRFNPTTKPYMISEKFTHLLDRRVPEAPDVLEWSRYFVVRERRVGRTECKLLAAVQQFCLEDGVTSLVGVQDMWWVPRWLQLGVDVRPLGLPQLVAGEPAMAVRVAISETALANVRRFAGLKAETLVRFAEPQERIRNVA